MSWWYRTAGRVLKVHLPPVTARWYENRDMPSNYEHPCDSRSKYRKCWGAYCQCKARSVQQRQTEPPK